MRKNMKILLIPFILFYLTGCVGVTTYGFENAADSDIDDSSGLFEDTTNLTYSDNNNYRNINVSHQDVINAWGKPDGQETYSYDRVFEKGPIPHHIKRKLLSSKKGEIWKYKTGISIKGILPIIIVPIPLIWYPDDYSYTHIYFKNGNVISVSTDTGAFNLQCMIILPIPVCINNMSIW